MKQVIAVLIIIWLALCVFEVQKAGAVDLAFPQETGMTAFYFPESGTFAAGVTHTFVRASFVEIPFLTIDADAIIAKEVTQEEEDLYGLGVKGNVNLFKVNYMGIDVLPNLGVGVLNNFKNFDNASDVLDNFKFAIYGTMLMYKW